TEEGWLYGPTRLVVRDAFLNAKWKNQMLERGLPLTEEKIENWINRLEGKAGRGGLRRTERVPAGTLFDFEMNYKVMDIEGDRTTDQDNFQKVLVAMRLVEMDALGGAGSRGYGRIEFQNLTKIEAGEESALFLPTPDQIFGRAA
ncbi:MAG: type III-A CRISPR-associated RAMP protein Csm3, partial [Deltaproteobacteria bacterium]|nr:type III-A CRISPR-associated RAMP protein Csm3 [Deltaproteobacteria bacterium]